MEYPDIMVDIETTGLQPDRNGILQIGAVKFNLKERTICPDFFDRALTMAPFRSWDKSTMVWWSQQPRAILDDINARAEPYKDVMQAFQQWALPAGSLRFWSKPTHFDYMYIASYFADCDLVNPFSYRDATDMNSYIRGLHGTNPVPEEIEKNVTHGGAAHNALNDCFYQLKVLFAHQDFIEGKL
jgi:predicted AlkP superfamily pyrophosphatase or phosphodiesterase